MSAESEQPPRVRETGPAGRLKPPGACYRSRFMLLNSAGPSARLRAGSASLARASLVTMILVASLTGFTLAWQPDAPQPSVALPSDLARVLEDYERAWRARDPQALSALFAEDGFVLTRGRPPVRGRDAIARHYARSGGPLSLRALAYAVDGRIAYIIGAYASERGRPDDGKFTLTLRKQGDARWQIVSDMDNSNGSPAAPGAPAAEAHPLSEIDGLMKAAQEDWNGGDLDAFVRPYHEDATFMTSRGPIGRREMRAAYEKNYFSGGKPRQRLAYEQLSTVPVGPDSALMTGRFVLSGGGQPEQSGWFTLVWVRTGAGWKILRDHTS